MDSLKTYFMLLLQLSDLMRAGDGDSEFADEIRDRMDEPWYLLSSQEMQVMDQVSSILYNNSVTWDEVLVMTVMVI
jgi:hypothetical protein